MFYHAAACNATHGIAVATRNSVCPSVCPFVRCVYCDKTKWWTADSLIPHETAITLVSDTNSGCWAMPPSLWNLRSKWPAPFEKRRFPPISAHNVSTVGDSEKSSITTKRKSTTSFPTSYGWSTYVAFKFPKGWFNEWFFKFFNKTNKVSHKVSLCENFQRQSCSTTIPVSNGSQTLAQTLTHQPKI